MTPHILVVDDEPINLEILIDNLQADGYTTSAACRGEEAWHLIEQAPTTFDLILLDRMMPDVDGIEILRRIKAHPDLLHTPVIMQTAMTADADVADGLRAGAYYYLTKPFSADTLLAIVNAALKDRREYLELQKEVREASRTLGCLRHARFAFRTTDEARNIATLIAHAAPDPARVVLGLTELMLNSIEHGNLGITYEEKSRLIRADELQGEIARRLALPDYADREATLEFERTADELSFRIQDQGHGFQWQDFLEMRPERAFDTHGRGIAMARLLSFDRLEFIGTGNDVVAAIGI